MLGDSVHVFYIDGDQYNLVCLLLRDLFFKKQNKTKQNCDFPFPFPNRREVDFEKSKFFIRTVS